MVKRIQDGIEEAEAVVDENAESRTALGALKANKKGLVGSVRPTTKGMIESLLKLVYITLVLTINKAGSTATTDSKKRKLPSLGNGQSANFQVYEDTNENAQKASRGGVVGNWSVLGAEATKYAENQPVPSKWTNQKVLLVLLT